MTRMRVTTKELLPHDIAISFAGLGGDIPCGSKPIAFVEDVDQLRCQVYSAGSANAYNAEVPWIVERDETLTVCDCNYCAFMGVRQEP